MALTAEMTEMAILEFYKNPGNVNKKCHEWLRNLQLSKESWSIVWPLFDTEKDLNVQFVAANILHYKVTRSLHEIPESDIDALKDKLILCIAGYINGPQSVLNKLSLTLGALVANTIGIMWSNPLEDLSSYFRSCNFPGVPEETLFKLLIQIYGYIPEHAETQWQQSVKRASAHRELQNLSTKMYSWLLNIMRTYPVDIAQEALKAINSWTRLLCICEWSEIKEFVDLTVSLCESSVASEQDELIELCLEALHGIVTDPNSHQYPSLVLYVLDKIIPLKSCIEVLSQRLEMELLTSFYGMYVSLADCHSKLIVEICDPESLHGKNNPKVRDNALSLIQIILSCSSFPGRYPIDELVSDLTIGVWYTIMEDIRLHQEDERKHLRIMQVFDEVYKSLVKILVKKAQYPLDDSEWTAQETEQFRIYRQDISDCFTYCYELRGWTMITEMVEWMSSVMTTVEMNPEQMRLCWPELESILIGVRAVAETISDETDSVLLQPLRRVFEVIYRILKFKKESYMTKLFQAAIECISACSGMLCNFQEILKAFVEVILESIFKNETVASATLALKTLSRDCTKELVPYAPQLLTACKQALETGRLSQNDSVRLVYCVGKFLPALPPDEMMNLVGEIFSPAVKELQKIAAQVPKPDEKAKLIGILNILSTLCASMDLDALHSDDEDDDPVSTDTTVGKNEKTGSSSHKGEDRPQPLLLVVEHIFPVLVPVSERWAKDSEVMDSLYAILKQTLITIKCSSQPVVEYTMRLVLLSCRIHPIPSAIAIARQTLLTLGKESFDMQVQFLTEMHSLCMQALESSYDTEFSESYLLLISQLVKSNVQLFNVSGIPMTPVLKLAMLNLNSPDHGLLKSCIYFMSNAIDKSTSFRPTLTEFFETNGPSILHTVVYNIGFGVPRSYCDQFADLIVPLERNFKAQYRVWLTQVLSVEGFPSPHATREAKSKFFLQLTKDRLNKRMAKDAIMQFAIACRNMSGTEYAIATSKRI